MIDRIKFYIDDVDIDTVEKRLDLAPIGVDRYEAETYLSTIKNLKFKYVGQRLMVEGSLHRFAKGNNYSLFTIKESIEAMRTLVDIIGIPAEKYIVSSIEIGINLQMACEPMRYIQMVHNYSGRPFIPMTPLSGTSHYAGAKCPLSEYTLKCYDKTYDAIRKGRVPVKKRHLIPENILRFEVMLKRKYLRAHGFRDFRGTGLMNFHYYSILKRQLKDFFENVSFRNFYLKYDEISQDVVKRYIFVTSANYQLYLDYLKKQVGEVEYRKEKRATINFLKRMDAYKTARLEREIKSKFSETLAEL